MFTIKPDIPTVYPDKLNSTAYQSMSGDKDAFDINYRWFSRPFWQDNTTENTNEEYTYLFGDDVGRDKEQQKHLDGYFEYVDAIIKEDTPEITEFLSNIIPDDANNDPVVIQRAVAVSIIRGMSLDWEGSSWGSLSGSLLSPEALIGYGLMATPVVGARIAAGASFSQAAAKSATMATAYTKALNFRKAYNAMIWSHKPIGGAVAGGYWGARDQYILSTGLGAKATPTDLAVAGTIGLLTGAVFQTIFTSAVRKFQNPLSGTGENNVNRIIVSNTDKKGTDVVHTVTEIPKEVDKLYAKDGEVLLAKDAPEDAPIFATPDAVMQDILEATAERVRGAQKRIEEGGKYIPFAKAYPDTNKLITQMIERMDAIKQRVTEVYEARIPLEQEALPLIKKLVSAKRKEGKKISVDAAVRLLSKDASIPEGVRDILKNIVEFADAKALDTFNKTGKGMGGKKPLTGKVSISASRLNRAIERLHPMDEAELTFFNAHQRRLKNTTDVVKEMLVRNYVVDNHPTRTIFDKFWGGFYRLFPASKKAEVDTVMNLNTLNSRAKRIGATKFEDIDERSLTKFLDRLYGEGTGLRTVSSDSRTFIGVEDMQQKLVTGKNIIAHQISQAYSTFIAETTGARTGVGVLHNSRRPDILKEVRENIQLLHNVMTAKGDLFKALRDIKKVSVVKDMPELNEFFDLPPSEYLGAVQRLDINKALARIATYAPKFKDTIKVLRNEVKVKTANLKRAETALERSRDNMTKTLGIKVGGKTIAKILLNRTALSLQKKPLNTTETKALEKKLSSMTIATQKELSYNQKIYKNTFKGASAVSNLHAQLKKLLRQNTQGDYISPKLEDLLALPEIQATLLKGKALTSKDLTAVIQKVFDHKKYSTNNIPTTTGTHTKNTSKASLDVVKRILSLSSSPTLAPLMETFIKHSVSKKGGSGKRSFYIKTDQDSLHKVVGTDKLKTSVRIRQDPMDILRIKVNAAMKADPLLKMAGNTKAITRRDILNGVHPIKEAAMRRSSLTAKSNKYSTNSAIKKYFISPKSKLDPKTLKLAVSKVYGLQKPVGSNFKSVITKIKELEGQLAVQKEIATLINERASAVIHKQIIRDKFKADSVLANKQQAKNISKAKEMEAMLPHIDPSSPVSIGKDRDRMNYYADLARELPAPMQKLWSKLYEVNRNVLKYAQDSRHTQTAFPERTPSRMYDETDGFLPKENLQGSSKIRPIDLFDRTVFDHNLIRQNTALFKKILRASVLHRELRQGDSEALETLIDVAVDLLANVRGRVTSGTVPIDTMLNRSVLEQYKKLLNHKLTKTARDEIETIMQQKLDEGINTNEYKFLEKKIPFDFLRKVEGVSATDFMGQDAIGNIQLGLNKEHTASVLGEYNMTHSTYKEGIESWRQALSDDGRGLEPEFENRLLKGIQDYSVDYPYNTNVVTAKNFTSARFLPQQIIADFGDFTSAIARDPALALTLFTKSIVHAPRYFKGKWQRGGFGNPHPLVKYLAGIDAGTNDIDMLMALIKRGHFPDIPTSVLSHLRSIQHETNSPLNPAYEQAKKLSRLKITDIGILEALKRSVKEMNLSKESKARLQSKALGVSAGASAYTRWLSLSEGAFKYPIGLMIAGEVWADFAKILGGSTDEMARFLTSRNYTKDELALIIRELPQFVNFNKSGVAPPMNFNAWSPALKNLYLGKVDAYKTIDIQEGNHISGSLTGAGQMKGLVLQFLNYLMNASHAKTLHAANTYRYDNKHSKRLVTSVVGMAYFQAYVMAYVKSDTLEEFNDRMRPEMLIANGLLYSSFGAFGGVIDAIFRGATQGVSPAVIGAVDRTSRNVNSLVNGIFTGDMEEVWKGVKDMPVFNSTLGKAFQNVPANINRESKKSYSNTL